MNKNNTKYKKQHVILRLKRLFLPLYVIQMMLIRCSSLLGGTKKSFKPSGQDFNPQPENLETG